MKKFLISALAVLLTSIVFAEGTKQFMPNSGIDIRVQVWDNNDTQRDFMTYGCPTTSRLNIRIKDINTEKIYFGMRQDNNDVYFRLRDPNGNIVMGPTLVPSSGAGYISTYNEAVAGPDVIDAVNGYQSLSYSPSIPGDYYLEFNPIDANTVTPGVTTVKRTFNFFDVTVVKTTDSSALNGRVWSNAWDFNCMSGSNTFDAQLHIYATDSVLTSLDFNGIQPWGFVILANRTGCNNTGDVSVDRQSSAGNVNYPEYKIFLQTPDTNSGIFEVTKSTPEIVGTPTIEGCNLTGYTIGIVTTHVGIAEIGINLNGVAGYQSGTTDVKIIKYLDMGENSIAWDGKDGLGSAVADNTTMDVYVEYQGGLTHIPIYDVENHSNGYNVNLIAPGSGTAEIFWDDTPLTGGGSNLLTGCTSNCHTWVTALGNVNTVNTYWVTHYDYDTLQFTLLYDCNPIAVNDTALVARDTQTDIDVTANDTEPDSEALTVSIITTAVNGTASVVSGNIRYTPNSGYVGADTVYYKICDAASPAPVRCDSAYVFIDVQCDDDGVPDALEVAGDADGDGIDNTCDLDSDNDGIRDDIEGSMDSDGDGIGNHLDLDSDNDGIPDALEANNGVAPTGYDASTGRIAGADTDSDGLVDTYDGAPSTAYGVGSTSTLADNDYDGDGVKNRLDKDSDYDGILDITEANGTDTNGDGSVDVFSDSNSDGIHDAYLSSPLTLTDTDGAGNPNFLDRDSDGDGITDNREGQSTAGFTAISGTTDTDGDGITDQFDTNSSNSPITPVDSDADGIKDYRDTDSDGDSILDAIEGNDNDQDGNADGAATSLDADNDGVDDGYESDAGAAFGGYSNYALQDTDSNTEKDFRDLDDDNDGIPTSDETTDSDSNSTPDYLEAAPCASGQTQASMAGTADAVHSENGTTDPTNSLNAADGNYTDIRNGDWIILDLTDTIPVGKSVTLVITKAQTTGGAATANVEQSLDGVTFTNLVGYSSTVNIPTFENFVYTIASTTARYIRVTRTARRIGLDAINYSFNHCVPDADNDGIRDRFDGDRDNDGIPNALETSGDTDGDGITNEYDLDSDNDGIPDAIEANGGSLPSNMTTQGKYPASYVKANDTDGDGLANDVDTDNGGTALADTNTDGDSYSNRIDLDSDNDGITDGVEANNGSMPSNMDANGQYTVAYAMANDTDGDGLVNDVDPDNGGTPLTNPDNDSDSTKDFMDTDADGDGVTDNAEGFDPDVTIGSTDTDGDGIDDSFDTDNGGTAANLPDDDSDGKPDYLDRCLISAQNGNFNDPATWGGEAPTDCNSCAIIGHSISLTKKEFASSVTINAGGSLDLSGKELELCGHLTNNGGSSDLGNSGKVTFKGSATQNITGNFDFYDLALDNATSLVVASGSAVTVDNEVTLTQGTLNTTAATSFTMIATSGNTAMFSGSGTGNISGDVTQQRYVEGCSGYLSFGAPFATTYQSYSNVYYQGFPSTSYPSDWKNIYYYDETASGTSDVGYTNPTDVTDALVQGQGFLVYQWSSLLPYTLSLKGGFRLDNVNLPISYTSTASGNLHDGFNFVANPYPATIDWKSASGWTKTGCCDAIYTYDRCGAQYASYVDGISVNSGTQYVGPLQGFWVKAHQASSSITLTRDVIVANERAYHSYDPQPEQATLKFGVRNGSFYDETAISFGDTSASMGPGYFLGAYKLKTDAPGYPHLYTFQEFSWDTYEMAINMNAPVTQSKSIKVGFEAVTAGDFDMSFTELSNFDSQTCIFLEDLLLDSTVMITDTTVYTFNEQNDSTETERFVLHFVKHLTTEIVQPNCISQTNGLIAAHADEVGQFTWFDASNEVVRQSSMTLSDTLTAAGQQPYTVHFEAQDPNVICGTVSSEVRFNEQLALPLSNTQGVDVSYCGALDGSASTSANSGYSFVWSNGETGMSITGLRGGTYSLSITDELGCLSTENIVINEPAFTAAYLLLEEIVYLDNGVATFEIDHAASNYTDLTILVNGDTVFGPTYEYTVSDTGVYAVELIASGLGCDDYASLDLQVLDTTTTISSVQLTDNQEVHVFPNPSTGSVYIRGEEIERVNVRDMLGKGIDHQFTRHSNQLLKLKNELNSGVYFIETITSGGQRNVTKLIVQ